MTSIIADLKNIKEKIQGMDLAENNENEINNEKSRKERVEMKLKNFFDTIDQCILLNIGGEIIVKTCIDIYLQFNYKLTIIDKLKSYKHSEPLFLDFSSEVWETLVEIIRINPIPSENEYNIYTKADICVLEEEAKVLFDVDWQKIKKLIKLHYLPINKKLIFLNEESSRFPSESDNAFWDSTALINCYLCGKVNNGSFWKIKHSSSTRSDEFVLNGYFGTCMTCDPSGTKKY